VHAIVALLALGVQPELLDPAKVKLEELRTVPVPAVYAKGRSPYQDVLDAARDVLTLPESERCCYRYLSFYNMEPAVRRPFADYALRYHLNLLSQESEFAFGVWATPTVLRIDLRDFEYDREVWDASASIDVFFHSKLLVAERRRRRTAVSSSGHHFTLVRGEWERTYTGKLDGERLVAEHDETARVPALAPWLPPIAASVLVRWASLPGKFHCRSPILRADWFLVYSSRQANIHNDERSGFGYYDFLGVKSRDDWFRVVRLDEDLAVRARKEIRSVVDVSGVSAQNRQIVRLASINGGVWGTLDVFDESDRGVAKRSLRRGQFRHDAERWFGCLANGLPATLAASAAGKLQASAPDKIGPNDSPRHRGRDPRIHVNFGCMECHDPKVLQPIKDWVRSTYVGEFKLGSPDKEVDKELKRQYFSDLQDALVTDNEAYRKAVWKCVRLSPHDISTRYGDAFYRYTLDRVGVERGAEELGVAPASFLASLRAANRAVGKLDPVLLGFLKVPDYKVSRLEWEDVYSVAASTAAGFVPPDN
jgi:hypothetical protein